MSGGRGRGEPWSWRETGKRPEQGKRPERRPRRVPIIVSVVKGKARPKSKGAGWGISESAKKHPERMKRQAGLSGKWEQAMGWVYILKCADGSYYVGSTTNLELRLSGHQMGVDPCAYTCSRRPLQLVWRRQCATILEAFQFEQQIKGWSRAKKEALVRGDWEEIHCIVQRERRKRERDRRR